MWSLRSSLPSNQTQPSTISNFSARPGMISRSWSYRDNDRETRAPGQPCVRQSSLMLDQNAPSPGAQLGWGHQNQGPTPDTSWLLPTSVNLLRMLFTSEYLRFTRKLQGNGAFWGLSSQLPPDMTHITDSPCHNLMAAGSRLYSNLVRFGLGASQDPT